MTSSIASVLDSVFKDPKIARKYANLFEEESIETIEDLQMLDVDDFKSMGIKELQAKRLLKNGQLVLLQIAVDRPENVIGVVRVYRGALLRDIRREIVADGLPVQKSFAFKQDGAVVTSAQEEKWTANMFFNTESARVCVVTYNEDTEKESSIKQHPRIHYAATSSSETTTATSTDYMDIESTDSPFTGHLQPPSSSLADNNETEKESWFTRPMEAISQFHNSSGSDIPMKVSESNSYVKTQPEFQPTLIQDKSLPLKKSQKPAATENPTLDISRKTDVYIGNLNPKHGIGRIGDDRLKSHVYQFGLVKRYQRLADDNWAYIIFGYPLSARVCIAETHGLRMGEHQLVCTYATDRTRSEPEKQLKGCLRLRGVPKATSSKDLMNAFVKSPYVQNIVRMKSKGEAFVMFREERNAREVFEQCRGGAMIRGQMVSVEMFDEFENYGHEVIEWGSDDDSDESEMSESKAGSSVRSRFTDAVVECLRSNAPMYDKKIVPLVTTDGRLSALCLVLVEQSVEEPSRVARLCADLSGADNFPQVKNYRFGDFKKNLLSNIETRLVINLDLLQNSPDDENGISCLTGHVRFLGHLHNLKVISPMILLGCANKIIKVPILPCRNAIKELLKLTENELDRQPHFQPKLKSLREFSSVKAVTRAAPASEDEEYQLVGEKLYTVIAKRYPQSAGKITGMLLEMGLDLACSLLENRQELYFQADRANGMLEGKGYY